MQTARIYSNATRKVFDWRSAVGSYCKLILLNDFTCRNTRLQNADQLPSHVCNRQNSAFCSITGVQYKQHISGMRTGKNQNA